MDANVLRSYCDVRTTRYTYSCVNCIWYAWYVVCTTVSVGVSFIYEGFVPWFQSLWNFDWKFDENLWNFDWNFDECLWNWRLMTLTSRSRDSPQMDPVVTRDCVWSSHEIIRCWSQICVVNFIVKRTKLRTECRFCTIHCLRLNLYKNPAKLHLRA